MIEIKRKVKREVEETIALDLKAFWFVRVIRTYGDNRKECIDEKEFDHEPTEEEVAEVLVKHMGSNVFASVVENYKLVDWIV